MNITTTAPRLTAVLGCTGAVGSEVVRQLAWRDCAVRGVLRRPPSSYPVPHQERPARVSYVLADHTSEEGLRRAFSGADSLFLLVGTNPEQVQIETRAIAAAERAGVRRIVKLSAPIVEAPASVEVAKWHRAIEERLAASALESCSLRPCAFMQNWLRNASAIRQFGTIIGSAGTAPRNYVDCRDVAAVAVRLLLSDAPPPSPALAITGPEVISNQEIAERIALVTGSAIRYSNLSQSAHYELLVGRARLPAWLARHIVELEALAAEMPEQATNEVARLLGQPARTMDEFLLEHRQAFTRRLRLDPMRMLFAQQ